MGASRPCARVTRKVAFITGASAGIGAATARALAADGYDLTLVGRRAQRLDALAEELRATHKVEARALVLDLRDAAALERAAKERPELFEQVDVLVNNAGLARGTDPVQSANPQDWDDMIDTNVRALLRVTRLVLPHMVARKRGTIVNLGSTAGRWVYPGGAVYCATKFAVRAISEGIRMDVHGSGVRVTNIEPGLVATEFSEVRFHGDKDRAKTVYEGYEPLRAEDIADTVRWCVSRPPHVDIQELVIFPTAQSAIRMLAKDTD